jgi:hypothetical protein
VVAVWLIDELQQLGPEVVPNLLLEHARRVQARRDYELGVESAHRRRQK